jgi:hypothetical protein
MAVPTALKLRALTHSMLSPYNSARSSKMVLLNGPPLSNFVDRGLGEWEWLGPGSTKIIFFNINSAHGPPKWYF